MPSPAPKVEPAKSGLVHAEFKLDKEGVAKKNSKWDVTRATHARFLLGFRGNVLNIGTHWLQNKLDTAFSFNLECVRCEHYVFISA